MYDKDSAIVFTTDYLCRQHSLKLEWVQTTANAAWINGLMCHQNGLAMRNIAVVTDGMLIALYF
jgi:hypothetical protein